MESGSDACRKKSDTPCPSLPMINAKGSFRDVDVKDLGL
jgi:hypothetical protein